MNKQAYDRKLENFVESLRDRAEDSLKKNHIAAACYMATINGMWAHTFSNGTYKQNPFINSNNPLLAQWFRFGMSASSDAASQDAKLKRKIEKFEEEESKKSSKKFLGMRIR